MTPSRTSHPVIYRSYQFFSALKAVLPSWAGGRSNQLDAEDEALVANILKTPNQQRLFDLMSPNDKQHSIAVARTLKEAGYNKLALLQAALLHDVGKSLDQPIPHRVLIVLLRAFWPQALQWLSNPGEWINERINESGEVIVEMLAQDEFDKTHFWEKFHASWWRRPFIIHALHPAIGATWAEKVGCEFLAIHLIAKHEDPVKKPMDENKRLLAALQWADNLN